MPHLSFYRQKRIDGALRTGIEVETTTVWHRYVDGDEDADPVLIWFVDLRCHGKSLPTDPDAVLAWFLRHTTLIREAFSDLAEELRAGMEPDLLPLQRAVRGAPRGVQMRVVFSAMRRVDGLGMAEVFRDLATNWETILQSLEQHVPVPR
jgi:hypothetical protein